MFRILICDKKSQINENTNHIQVEINRDKITKMLIN
jgi:hypothetical protein